jgi:Protein of unknown function (DUF3617)
MSGTQLRKPSMIRPIALLSLCLAVAAAPFAHADGLAIKTGLWKKTITTGGQALTLDACYTAEDLSFDQLNRFGADMQCTWTKKDVSATRIAVAFACPSMTGESTTVVESPELVHLTSTSQVTMGGTAQVVNSTEEWRFVSATCPPGQQ